MKSLFDQEEEFVNLLPYDGTANYYGNVLSPAEADFYFRTFMEKVQWRSDELIMAGRRVVTTRKVAWYAEKLYEYTYSGIPHKSLLWFPELLDIKKLVERLTNTTFNSCLFNLYHNGSEGLSWHSDRESSMMKNMPIASLSLGAARKFMFKHKRTKLTRELILDPGSLLVMRDETQTHWQHCVPKTVKVKTPRINLTFRVAAIPEDTTE